jgi:hypothetical protein
MTSCRRSGWRCCGPGAACDEWMSSDVVTGDECRKGIDLGDERREGEGEGAGLLNLCMSHTTHSTHQTAHIT